MEVVRWIACSLQLASAAAAQRNTPHRSLPGPLKDAGVLRLADGTWDRGPLASLGPKTIYNNDASTGFFGPLDPPEEWTDEGRIPGCDDLGQPGTKRYAYEIDGFQVAYCTSQPTGSGSTDLQLTVFELYAACTDSAGLVPAAAFQVSGLPGATSCGSTACWIVTLDLEGTSFAFQMDADGDQGFDEATPLDNFGWSFTLLDASCGAAGPLLCGDPTNFPAGDGTYYQNPGQTGTGLATQDQFWLSDASGAETNGCYGFGGYPSGNPYASFWLQLYGAQDLDNCGDPGQEYCQANPNSCGAPTDLSIVDLWGGTFELSAAPVPLQPGIFFHAADQIRVPFGNGFLCAAGGIQRLLPPVFPDVACGTARVDQLLADYSGERNFQYWYRDPDGGGAFFNTSNALNIHFEADGFERGVIPDGSEAHLPGSDGLSGRPSGDSKSLPLEVVDAPCGSARRRRPRRSRASVAQRGCRTDRRE